MNMRAAFNRKLIRDRLLTCRELRGYLTHCPDYEREAIARGLRYNQRVLLMLRPQGIGREARP